jgi:hypothetical protein
MPPRGRLQIGTVAGFKSERVAGIKVGMHGRLHRNPQSMQTDRLSAAGDIERRKNMPNFNRSKTGPEDDLEIASRVMNTVQQQIVIYRASLEKVRLMRKELQLDNALATRIWRSPDEMMKVFMERGIPQELAGGMAAEEFQDPNFKGGGGGIGFWTWDCCCITSCQCTLVTSIGARPPT